MTDDCRIGLCFSGGGARGVAHIGVLKGLMENDIQPDVISGTSAGAIIGALHAAGKSPEEMLELAQKSSLFKIYKIGMPKMGLTNLTYLRGALEKAIPEDDFDKLSLPLYVSMTNLLSGALEIKSKGKLYEAIEASCSVPLIFKPVEIAGNYYVDGGLLSNLPVAPILDESDIVIGVNVMPHVEVSSEGLNSWMGITSRVFDLSLHVNTQSSASLCDILIEPEGIEQFGIWQFSRHAEMYQAGYNTAIRMIPLIKAKIESFEQANSTEEAAKRN